VKSRNFAADVINSWKRLFLGLCWSFVYRTFELGDFCKNFNFPFLFQGPCVRLRLRVYALVSKTDPYKAMGNI
jgi:hypothetical protein